MLGHVEARGVERALYVCSAGIVEARATDKRSHSSLKPFNNEEISPNTSNIYSRMKIFDSTILYLYSFR